MIVKFYSFFFIILYLGYVTVIIIFSFFFSRFCISWKSHTILFVSSIENIHISYNTSFGECQFSSISVKSLIVTPEMKKMIIHRQLIYQAPSGFESGLGQQEYQNVVLNVVDLANPSTVSPATGRQLEKRQSYAHYSGEVREMRAKIGKYAAENGNEKARKHFSKDCPDLKESTIRNFKKKYHVKLAEAHKAGNTEVICIPSEVRGRPPVLMDLDNKLLTFLKGIRSRGGVINVHVVRGVTHALTTSNPAMTHLNNFDMPRSWVHSIYKRMGYTVRAGTTSRSPVPYGLYTENRYTFLSSIVETVEQHSIPFELILNADQTPSSYVSVGKMTMAKRGEKSVPIKGLTDKRNITLTFAVTFTGDFLPMQIIYAEAKHIAVSREALSSQKGTMSPKMKSIGPMKPKPSTLLNKSLILTSLINEKNWDCLLIRKCY